MSHRENQIKSIKRKDSREAYVFCDSQQPDRHKGCSDPQAPTAPSGLLGTVLPILCQNTLQGGQGVAHLLHFLGQTDCVCLRLPLKWWVFPNKIWSWWESSVEHRGTDDVWFDQLTLRFNHQKLGLYSQTSFGIRNGRYNQQKERSSQAKLGLNQASLFFYQPANQSYSTDSIDQNWGCEILNV